MNKVVYRERRSYLKYDEQHIIGYLNEEIVKDFQPETQEGEKQPDKFDGFAYEGEETDGGTILECSKPNDRGELINAVIRYRYSLSEELAIHRHHEENALEEVEEWKVYNEFCEKAKLIVDNWLA